MVESNATENLEEGNGMLTKGLYAGAALASIYIYQNYLSCAPAPKHP